MPKRRKRRFPWISFLWLLLAGNVAAGLWLSPVTAPRKVRVEGAPESLKPFIASQLASLRDVPCARVDAAALETKVQALPGVRTASFHRNVFGSGTLTFDLHVPVARVEGRSGLYLSDRGALFRSKDAPQDLPVIRPPEGFDAPHLAIADTWQSGEAARALRLAGESGALKGVDPLGCLLEIGSSGSVSLALKDGPVIEFGSAERLIEKFAKLKELLGRNPKLLDEIISLNLTAPNRPMIVSKSRQQSK